MSSLTRTVTPMNPQELVALQQRQQAAAPQWWTLSAEEVARAYAAGRRDFRRANLTRADLTDADLTDADLTDANLTAADLTRANLTRANLTRANLTAAHLTRANLTAADLFGADLSGAHLTDANLRRVPGVYSDYSPFLSSRGTRLLGGLDIVDDAIVLRFWAGCQECKTAEELRARVKRKHGDNLHAELYELAIAHIEAAFAAEMKAGKYGYLLTWNADHPAEQTAETSVAEE